MNEGSGGNWSLLNFSGKRDGHVGCPDHIGVAAFAIKKIYE